MIMFKLIEIFNILLFLSQALSGDNKQEDFIRKFQQFDYQIKIERLVLERSNKQYVDSSIKTFKYNRTSTAFNVTADFKIDMGYQVEGVVQAYKFASNEYRLFPMRFQMNICDAISEDVFGLEEVGKVVKCPMKQGKIQICNFTPDAAHFPPLIPTGKYMWEMQGMYFSEEIMMAKFYMEIVRPFV